MGKRHNNLKRILRLEFDLMRYSPALFVVLRPVVCVSRGMGAAVTCNYPRWRLRIASIRPQGGVRLGEAS